MLDRDFVKRADDGPLEQRPNVLDAVGVDESADPFLCGVIDGFVPGILIAKPIVGRPVVGVNRFGFVCDVLPNPAMERATVAGMNDLQANLAVPFHRTNDGGFVGALAPRVREVILALAVFPLLSRTSRPRWGSGHSDQWPPAGA